MTTPRIGVSGRSRRFGRSAATRRVAVSVLVMALSLCGSSCALVGFWGDGGAAGGPGPATGSGGGKEVRSVASKGDGEFAESPVGNESDASARLVGLKADTGDDVETVTFTFADTDVLPEFQVSYIDALRAHPEDEPLPLSGNAVLEVEFSLTNPNTKNRLAVRPDLTPGHPQIKEVLLARNLGGSLTFGVGLERRAPFRATQLSNPTRLVVEVRTR
jgi:hypothetical protein